MALLDRALTSYRLNAHARDPKLKDLEAQLATATDETKKQALQSEIDTITTAWNDRQNKLKSLYRDLRKAEDNILDLEDQLAAQLKLEEENRNKFLSDGDGEGHDPEDKHARLAALSQDLDQGNFGSKEVTALRERIAQFQGLASASKSEFEALTAEINDELELKREHVLNEFSAISGVPVSKLTQDERAKLARP